MEKRLGKRGAILREHSQFLKPIEVRIRRRRLADEELDSLPLVIGDQHVVLVLAAAFVLLEQAVRA